MEIFPTKGIWESQHMASDFGTVVHTDAADGAPSVIVVCEHASNRVPAFLNDMGLGRDGLDSHIAWDPGALGVARSLASAMGAPLVYGGVSRLVYDCNRPPDASDAMPEQSEDRVIPANASLTNAQREERTEAVYRPFARALSDEIVRNRKTLELMVTVHSFTPIYRGEHRAVELGILHGLDDRFAQAMLAAAPAGLGLVTRLNEPYSAADGVAHTLDAQAVPNGLLNVMIEIRNDLIRTPEQQQAISAQLAPWISRTLSGFQERQAV